MTDIPHNMPRKRHFTPGQDYLHKQFSKAMFVAHHPHDHDVLIFEMSDNDRDFVYFATTAKKIKEN